MSSLRTQITSDAPRVFLLGKAPSFFDRVQKFFNQHEIETYALSASELSSLDTKTLDTQSIYKIIWWVDFFDAKETLEILRFLMQFPSFSLMVIGEIPENFVFSQEKNEKYFEAREVFTQVTQSLPQAQFFLLRDFLVEKEISSFFQFVLQNAEKNILLDPEKEVFFTDLESLFQSIESAFFKPHTPQKIVVQGKAGNSTKHLDFLSQLHQTYYQSPLELIPVVAERQSPEELSTFFPVVASCDVKKHLDQIAQEKEQWKNFEHTLPFSPQKQSEKALTKPIETVPEPVKTVVLTSPAVRELPVLKNEIKKEDKILIDQSKDDFLPTEEQLEGKLSRLFQKKREEKKEKRIDEKVKIVKKISAKSKKNKVLFVGGVGVMILGGITLALWLILEVTSSFARKEALSYFQSNTPTKHETFTTGVWADFLQKQVGWYQPIAGDLLSEKMAESEFLQNLEQLQILQEKVEKETQAYVSGILGSGGVSPAFPPQIQEQLGQIKQHMAQLETTLPQVFVETTAEQQPWLDFFKESQQKLSLLQQLPEFFTRVLGGEGKKTYAVLLQNNLEIRATGGFLQSLALVTFDKGLLIDTQVLSTYDIDTKLPGAVNAPLEIQQFLGEKNWYIRDGNWDPDFPLTAQRISWFIKESLKKQVDGVIALNYASIQDLLGALGPMDLPAYSETLTKDNLLERVEFHSDAEFIRTNSQEKDYSQLVFTQLLQHMKTNSAENLGKIPEALYQSLTHKNVLLSFTDEKNQTVVQKMGWSGEVVSPTCPQRFPQTNCIVDSFYQVETNVGLNRVNGYIHRKISERVDFSGDVVKHVRTFTIENTAQSEGWPLGTYKAYIRFISGKNTNPKELTINGKKLDAGAALIYLEKNKKIVGFPLEVPKGASVTVQYTYETEKLSNEPFSFLFFDQKQPGIERPQLNTTFYFPDKKPTLIAPQGNLVGDTLDFTSEDDDHSFVGVSFQTK